jgi:DNA-binding response OmpR family regulator
MKLIVYVLEDELDIQKLLQLNLEKAGYKVRCFSKASQLFKKLAHELPDLLILDLMLPDEDGNEVVKKIRNHKRIERLPIMILSAKGDEIDKILGLELGADDYVTKPFSPKEVIVRIKAILRRAGNSSTTTVFKHGALEVDIEKVSVLVDSENIELTTTEFKILQMLIAQPGWVVSRDQMLDQIWGEDTVVIDRTIDVHIRNLRDKLNSAGNYIKNVRGIGYKMLERPLGF